MVSIITSISKSSMTFIFLHLHSSSFLPSSQRSLLFVTFLHLFATCNRVSSKVIVSASPIDRTATFFDDSFQLAADTTKSSNCENKWRLLVSACRRRGGNVHICQSLTLCISIRFLEEQSFLLVLPSFSLHRTFHWCHSLYFRRSMVCLFFVTEIFNETKTNESNVFLFFSASSSICFCFLSFRISSVDWFCKLCFRFVSSSLCILFNQQHHPHHSKRKIHKEITTE